jgi:hypothetical protein
MWLLLTVGKDFETATTTMCSKLRWPDIWIFLSEVMTVEGGWEVCGLRPWLTEVQGCRNDSSSVPWAPEISHPHDMWSILNAHPEQNKV